MVEILEMQYIKASSDTDTHNRQLHEFTSAEMDTLTDRLIATIFANDYSGTYKLGSSAPSSDYDVHLSGVFTDTRTDAKPKYSHSCNL